MFKKRSLTVWHCAMWRTTLLINKRQEPKRKEVLVKDKRMLKICRAPNNADLRAKKKGLVGRRSSLISLGGTLQVARLIFLMAPRHRAFR